MEIVYLILLMSARIILFCTLISGYIEIKKIKNNLVTLSYLAGTVSYGCYTFTTRLSTDVNDPYKLFALLGLVLILRSLIQVIRIRRNDGRVLSRVFNTIKVIPDLLAIRMLRKNKKNQ